MGEMEEYVKHNWPRVETFTLMKEANNGNLVPAEISSSGDGEVMFVVPTSVVSFFFF